MDGIQFCQGGIDVKGGLALPPEFGDFFQDRQGAVRVDPAFSLHGKIHVNGIFCQPVVDCCPFDAQKFGKFDHGVFSIFGCHAFTPFLPVRLLYVRYLF